MAMAFKPAFTLILFLLEISRNLNWIGCTNVTVRPVCSFMMLLIILVVDWNPASILNAADHNQKQIDVLGRDTSAANVRRQTSRVM